VRAIWVLRLTRVCIFVAFAVGLGVAVHRLRRTPEQRDLTRFVEVEVPRLHATEQPIYERLQRLNPSHGLTAERARALLVDDVNPRLIALRKQVESLRPETQETRRLIDEYLAFLDRLVEACRATVRAIDDPDLPDGAGYLVVKAHFSEVDRARQMWDEHVRLACVQHRLAPPGAQTSQVIPAAAQP
jgi:hypothetical protein